MEKLNALHGRAAIQPAGVPRMAGTMASANEDLAKLIIAGLDTGNAAVALFAPDDSFAFASETFRSLFDIQPGARTFDDVMRHCHAARKGPNFSCDIDTWLASAGQKRRSRHHRAFEIDMRDGRWFWANETAFAGGWLLLVITEITVLKSNERMLRLARDVAELAAGTDSLTGLRNRRFAINAFSEEIEKAKANSKPLSIALIDLDRFKTINDEHGHIAGDTVLCDFADLCRCVLRKRDVFARIGGEEFLLIMPNTDLGEAAVAVERLRSQAETTPSTAGIGYTLSAGVALHAGDTLEQLFHRADRALYRAKHLGRNRLELATPAPE